MEGAAGGDSGCGCADGMELLRGDGGKGRVGCLGGVEGGGLGGLGAHGVCGGAEGRVRGGTGDWGGKKRGEEEKVRGTGVEMLVEGRVPSCVFVEAILCKRRRVWKRRHCNSDDIPTLGNGLLTVDLGVCTRARCRRQYQTVARWSWE